MKLIKVNINVAGTFDVTLNTEKGDISINSTGEILNIEIEGNTSYNISGKVSSVGNISIGYNLSGKVSSIGILTISYNLSGKISTIGNISVGYNLSGKISSIGNVIIGYNLSGKVSSIGNNSIGYNLSGKVSSGNRTVKINDITFSLKGGN
ncbi:MAG: hypothetical protein APF83_08825 [Lutibacter sp. BRH_c52]|nr:MAG: hypothetical protein APF83_08825 [Lutibacter sp. BRH_c52]